MFYVILYSILFFVFNTAIYSSNTDNRYFLYETIEKGNVEELKTLIQKENTDINEKDSIYGYNLLSYSLLESNYEMAELLKQLGGIVSKDTFFLYYGDYLGSLRKINIEEILYFSYPEKYNYDSENQNIVDGLPYIYTQIVLYLLDEPIETLNEFYHSYGYFYNLMGKESFYHAVENYILGLLNTDFNWPVTTNNNSFNIDFSFTNKAIEAKGYTKVDQTDIIYGENSMSIDQKKENYLWTMSKFFHRRGELFGNLCSLYLIKTLEDLATKDSEASTLLEKYGNELKIRYNQFAKKWNKGIMPLYPYEKFQGKHNKFGKFVKIPLHLNPKYLKEKIDKLPIFDIPIFDSSKDIERIWNVDYKQIHYFESSFEIIKEKFTKLNEKSSQEDISDIYFTINQSSYKYSAETWEQFYFKIKELKLDCNTSDIVLEKVIFLLQKDCIKNSVKFYDFINSIIEKGYKYDAIKVYNSIKIKNIQNYKNSYENSLRHKLGGAISISAARYFKNNEFLKLAEQNTLKKFLFKSDYEIIAENKGYEEIIILLDKEEIQKLYMFTREILENEASTLGDLIAIFPPHYFFGQWPVEVEAKRLYETLFLEYIRFLDKQSSREEILYKLGEVLFQHEFENKLVYDIFYKNLKDNDINPQLLKLVEEKYKK